MSSQSTIGSITLCLNMLKRGDREGAQPLWNAYFNRLVRLASLRLGRSTRRGADEEDVALSALNSFMIRAEEERFPRVEDRDDLWQMLYVITVRKSLNIMRKERTKRHNPGVMVSLSELALHEAEIPIDPEPTPELAAQFAEQIQLLLNQLDDPTLRQIAIWKMEDHTNKEIAARVGVIEKTIERKLRRIREIWSEGGCNES